MSEYAPSVVTDSIYDAENIANWLYKHNIGFRHWFNTQFAMIGMFTTEGQHDRARELLDRAAEISDHLRAMGAVHLLH